MSVTALVALVSESPAVPIADLAPVGAAIQKQCVRDLARFWDVDAAVSVFASLGQVPAGYWPVIIRDDIAHPESGVHLDDHGQPMALVVADDNWTVTASHEIVEMLVDPFGNRMIAGDSPIAEQGRVEFLVEIADPCADPASGYTCDGVMVSDFCTPRYFDPEAAPGVQYSYRGTVTRPREVLRGGYLTWRVPDSGEWWQQVWFDGPSPRMRRMDGMAGALGAIRSRVDAATEILKGSVERVSAERGGPKRSPVAAGVVEASRAKERVWRKAIDRLVERSGARRGRA